MTTYINPFLANTVTQHKPDFRRDLFKEAATLGFLVKNAKGEPYIQTSAGPLFSFGTIDLTSKEAADWYAAIIRCNMLGDQRACPDGIKASAQVFGFMSDFGEYIPVDGVFASGESGHVVHNRFPEMWTALCRRAVREAGVEDDILFWSRSASPRSPGSASMFWAGDQLESWDRFDGIKSGLQGMLSGGLSGMAMTHTDIGGYTSVSAKDIVIQTRTKELLLRWMELSSLCDTVYRTHLGSAPNASQIYDDDETLRSFAYFSHVHRILAPYRNLFVEEATTKGHPIARFMFLEFPDDPYTWTLARQMMLGTEFIAAPVMDKGADSVDVYLPAGTWVHAFTGENFISDGYGKTVTVAAPLGSPPCLLQCVAGHCSTSRSRHPLARQRADKVAARLQMMKMVH